MADVSQISVVTKVKYPQILEWGERAAFHFVQIIVFADFQFDQVR